MEQESWSIPELINKANSLSKFDLYNYIFKMTNGFDERSIHFLQSELKRYLLALFKFTKDGKEYNVHEFAETISANIDSINAVLKDKFGAESWGFYAIFSVLSSTVDRFGGEVLKTQHLKNLVYVYGFLDEEIKIRTENKTDNKIEAVQLYKHLEPKQYTYLYMKLKGDYIHKDTDFKHFCFVFGDGAKLMTLLQLNGIGQNKKFIAYFVDALCFKLNDYNEDLQ